MRWIRWICLPVVASLGCAETTTPKAAPAKATATSAAVASSAAPSSSGPRAPEALRAAWRASVKYRSAHAALVENLPSIQTDERRFEARLEALGAYAKVPVVADPGADAAAVKGLLMAHADRLGVKARISVAARLPPRMPPASVLANEGVEYSDEQLLGAHELRVSFANRAAARTFVDGLAELDRRPALSRLHTVDGRTVVEGLVHYFRAIEPVRVRRAPVEVDAIVVHALGGVAEAGSAGATAARLRANYAQVDALQPRLEEAYALESRLKILTGRFRVFAEVMGAVQDSGWMVLTGKLKKKSAAH